MRFRVDGVLKTIHGFLPAQAAITSRIKVMANMDISEKRPQDGQINIELGEEY